MVANDLSTLLEEIESRLHEMPTGEQDAMARVEETLTDGYARALALEAERWRIERRLTEVARRAADGAVDGLAAELTDLSERLELAEGDLRLLRERLALLRRRAAAARAA